MKRPRWLSSVAIFGGGLCALFFVVAAIGEMTDPSIPWWGTLGVALLGPFALWMAWGFNGGWYDDPSNGYNPFR